MSPTLGCELASWGLAAPKPQADFPGVQGPRCHPPGVLWGGGVCLEIPWLVNRVPKVFLDPQPPDSGYGGGASFPTCVSSSGPLGPFLPLTSPSPWLPAWAWGRWGPVT